MDTYVHITPKSAPSKSPNVVGTEETTSSILFEYFTAKVYYQNKFVSVRFRRLPQQSLTILFNEELCASIHNTLHPPEGKCHTLHTCGSLARLHCNLVHINYAATQKH